MRKSTNIILSFSVLALFFVGSIANAQLPGAASIVTIQVIPKIPAPNQEVLVTLESFSADLNRAEIVWFLNGKRQQRGTGLKTLQFKVGEVGSSSRLNITITTQTGKIINEELIFRPADVDILLTAHTYIPPFYRGRALPSSKSKITLTAVPKFVTTNGTRLSPDNLVYTWG